VKCGCFCCRGAALGIADHLGGGSARFKANRRFQFNKRQLFIGTHNETLSAIAVRIRNPDCSPARIHG